MGCLEHNSTINWHILFVCGPKICRITDEHMETIEPWISHLGRVSPLHDGARALRSPADEHAASVPALLVCAGAPGTLYPPPLAAPVQCAHAPHVLREKQQPTSVNVNSKRFKLKGGGGNLTFSQMHVLSSTHNKTEWLQL